ncbi:MAG TPA: HD domain-containing phosphohydrolase [Kineosporiaceae bacterium]|nr:HD domain-containing phosphohydrolase [Kineosporiaceae bacterium]
MTTIVPFVLAVGIIAAGGRLVPRPSGAALAGWYAGICAASWVVLWLSHRILRRLLPLAGLLEMSLLFPDKAPSRLRLARRVASRKELEDLLAGRAVHDRGESTQQAAERILTLVAALSEHDRSTRGHSERVRVLSDLIAARMGLPERDRDRLRWAALLHDIGKLQVPATLLNKPATPSTAEWNILRRHPHLGAEIAAPLMNWLDGWGDVIVQHHEKWDGSGYPAGLSGKQICLGARIVAVADAYDVMTATRAYKKPSGRAAALRELVACSGGHFDPDVVRALITTPARRLLLTMGPLSWITGLPFVGQAPMALSATLAGQATAAAGALALTGTAALSPLMVPAASSVDARTPPAHSRTTPDPTGTQARLGRDGRHPGASPAMGSTPTRPAVPAIARQGGGPQAVTRPTSSPSSGLTRMQPPTGGVDPGVSDPTTGQDGGTRSTTATSTGTATRSTRTATTTRAAPSSAKKRGWPGWPGGWGRGGSSGSQTRTGSQTKSSQTKSSQTRTSSQTKSGG